MFNHNRLKCYGMALELARKVPDLVARWPRGTYYLEDQLKRAMASVPLNIAEGNGRSGVKERARFFSIARGSAMEVASVMDVAEAFDFISREQADYFRGLLLQIVKILYKLK